MEKTKVIVIGAGAAGLAAAYGALSVGASVVVLEHMSDPGKKLLLTGAGRCNLTNSDMSAAHYHGDAVFAGNVLQSFSTEDCLNLMHSIGVETTGIRYRYAEGLYYYPEDAHSSSVREAFLRALDRRGVKILTDCVIQTVKVPGEDRNAKGDEEKRHDGDGNLHTPRFFVETTKGTFQAQRLIISTGSNAAPVTGSDSSLYPVLKKLDIPMHPWIPALVPLKCLSAVMKKLSGLRVLAEAGIQENRRSVYRQPCGEIQFTQHYISGIPVLQLSRYAAIAIREKRNVFLRMKITGVLNKDGTFPDLQPEEFSEGEYLHPVADHSGDEACLDLCLKVNGTGGFDRAQVCSGGVDTADIDPETMEYCKIPGLSFAGELLNVDGDCGGYNLHFAFGTGWMAGRSAGK